MCYYGMDMVLFGMGGRWGGGGRLACACAGYYVPALLMFFVSWGCWYYDSKLCFCKDIYLIHFAIHAILYYYILHYIHPSTPLHNYYLYHKVYHNTVQHNTAQ